MRWLWLLAVALAAARAVGMGAAPRLDLPTLLQILRPAASVLREVRAAEPQFFLDLETRLRGWGYPFEFHTVRSEDGYQLGLHRIPRGRNATKDPTASRPPVLFFHGLMSNSESFLALGRERSIALPLTDVGYDVWLLDARGNHYSRKHKTLKRHDPKYWKFSWHEIGYYDIPAAIDYVLNTTKQEKLFFVGHSMGSTAFFVAMSMRPEYNAKVRLHISLAPGVFVNLHRSFLFDLTAANSDYFKVFMEAAPTNALTLEPEPSMALAYLLCSEKSFFNQLCPVIVSFIAGSVDLSNTTGLPLLLARSSGSTSSLAPWHYLQIVQTGEFAQLDHGPEHNNRLYGSPRPPQYPLHKVTAPVALYAAENDIIVPEQAAERLVKFLPNVASKKIIREKFFNHIDIISHRNLKELITDHVLEQMKRF